MFRQIILNHYDIIVKNITKGVVCINIKCASSELSSLSENIIELFYKQTTIQPIDVHIEFLDDLFDRRLELTISEKDKEDVLANKDFIASLNGTMVLPKTRFESPFILISNSAVNDSCQFISTLIHELTNIHDFYNFSEFHSLQSFSTISSLIDFDLFYYWTEYHARRLGYYFYRQILLSKDTRSTTEHIEHIKSTEYPFHFRYLCTELSKHTNNPTLYFYDLMQFIGRFSIWETLYPEIQLPPELDMIDELYRFLSTHNTFSEFISDIHQLRTCINNFHYHYYLR